MLMAENFKAFQSPEDKVRHLIVDYYNYASMADAEGAKKRFCSWVESFTELLKVDMSKALLTLIENRHTELDARIKAIKDNEKLSNEVKEKQIIEEEYKVFKKDKKNGIDAMRNSKILKRRVTGIILSGKTIEEDNKHGEKIRSSGAVETVIDDEDDLDGIEMGDAA
jgi:hypothetical protein